jgi:hypothetical protein
MRVQRNTWRYSLVFAEVAEALLRTTKNGTCKFHRVPDRAVSICGTVYVICTPQTSLARLIKTRLPHACRSSADVAGRTGAVSVRYPLRGRYKCFPQDPCLTQGMHHRSLGNPVRTPSRSPSRLLCSLSLTHALSLVLSLRLSCLSVLSCLVLPCSGAMPCRAVCPCLASELQAAGCRSHSASV